MILKWWLRYQDSIRGKTIARIAGGTDELTYWQDLLFFNFLFYCLPVSFIALIPGVFMALKDGYPAIVFVDVATLILLAVITFSHSIALNTRKFFVISIFYILSVFLINQLGYVGPGVFYLFAITILVAIVFPKNYAYWSILVNTIILTCFALVIRFNLFNCSLNLEYTPGIWIAFSSNLVFLSIVLVALINRIFRSLQDTINDGKHLQLRYKSIFEKSPLPMWIFDVQSLRFLDVNEAAIRHYGYSEEEFLKMTIKDIRPGEYIAALEDLVKTTAKPGQYYHGSTEHIKKGGQRINVKIESNRLVFDGQEVRLVLATDITDKMRSEREVHLANLKTKKSEAGLRAIFESSADGFILIDDELIIKAFNSKAKEYIQLNKQKSEFEVGRSIFEYMEPYRKHYFRSSIRRVLKGDMVDYDRMYPSGPGSVQWVHVTLTPVYEDRSIKGVCITSRDVTVRKLYLQNLEDQNKTFREISWMQSHLVRAPLARLMGLTNLLIASRDEDMDQILNLIQLSADELDEVIKKITQESRQILDKYPVPADVDNKEKS